MMMIKRYFLLAIFIAIAFNISAQSSQANTNTGAAGANAIQPIPNSFGVPATAIASPSPTAKNKIKLIVLARRSGTSRPLGSVKITMSDSGSSQDVLLSDPPNPSGQPIFEATAGKYTLTIERAGYKTISNKQIELVSGNDLKLTVDLEPESNTASPELEYQARLLALMYANITNQSNASSYWNQNTLLSQNPYMTYNNQAGQYETNSATNYNPLYSQNGYMLTANQTSVIPIILKIQMYGLLNANQSSNITLIDTSTGNSVTIASGDSLTNSSYSYTSSASQIYRSGCIKPNTQYILRISNNQQYSTLSLPYQDFGFLSPSIGNYVDVTLQPPLSVNYGGSNVANVTIQNIPNQSNQYQLGINCPSTYNSYSNTTSWPVPGGNYNTGTNTGQPPYGTTTWIDRSVNTINFGNYRVEQNANQTGYYLVSNTNIYEQRQIKFVENNSGSGGLAFIPAESTINGNSSYSSQWYVTTYTRNIDAQITKCISYIGRLQALAQYEQLSSNIKNNVTESLSVINTDNSNNVKARLSNCNLLKSSLISNLKTINSSILIPSVENSSSDAPIVNLTNLTRVNFTPEQYSQAVSGQVLNTF